MANGNYFGAGTSFADFNGDGWPDITCATYTDLFIYQNNEGVCEFVSLELDLDFDVKLPVCVDFDNNGDGTFTDIAVEAGVDLDQYGWGANWVDIDNDGFLDLYICEYYY